MVRATNIQRLKEEDFDVLIVGGGASGSGAALESAVRGFRTAMIEKDDFASETSSRSTKLLHGGVRYLEQAVKRLDSGQYHLVKEALHERQVVNQIAPHLSWVLPLLTPLYRNLDIPYYMAGLMLYDKLSGARSLGASKFVGRSSLLELLPDLGPTGVKGGVVYYDGQFDDSRMAVSIAKTAVEQGAAVANHVELIDVLHRNNKVRGVRVRDRLRGDEFEIEARVVINATGPFSDRVREMDEPNCRPILATSSGAHIVVDRKWCPREAGILVPKTRDGRVLFVLPWMGATVIGTTDEPAELEANPKPTQEQVRYILQELKTNLNMDIPFNEIRSAWSGLRPLVGGAAGSTAKISRDHHIEIARSGLVSIMGGKWTTYRIMAIEVVDAAARIGDLIPTRQSDTAEITLVGGENYTPELGAQLAEEFQLEEKVARHLAHNYGSRARKVLDLGKSTQTIRPLVDGYPNLECEVLYGTEHEMARTAIDFLARRTRLFFLDQTAALSALERTSELVLQQRKAESSLKAQLMDEAMEYFSLPNFSVGR